MTPCDRDPLRAAAAQARRDAARAAQALREKVRAERMAARAEALADRAEAKLGMQADRLEARRDARAARTAVLAMRQSDRRTNHQVLGAVLLAIGGNWLLAELGLFPFGWPGLLAAGLMTLGIAMISTAKAGRTKPLVAIGVLMTVLLAFSSGVSGGVGPVVGDETHRIRSADELQPLYENGLGDMALDLTALRLEESREVRVTTQVGDIEVALPRDLPVKITAEVAGPGEIDLFGSETEGIRRRAVYESPGYDDAPAGLELHLSSSVGDIAVVTS